MANVKMSALDNDTSIGGAEKLLALDSTTSKTITTAAMAAYAAAYAVDTLLDADAATPTTGDNLVGERSGTEKLLDLDAVASYVIGSSWSDPTTAAAAVTGDLIQIGRDGTIYVLDVDDLQTYVLAGIQGTVLNLSGLSTATLADTDLYLVGQGTAAKKTTWAAIAARAHSQLSTYTAALDAVATPGDTDKIYTIQGTTAKYITNAVLATYVGTKVTSGIVAGIWDAGAVSPVTAADVFVLERSDVRKTATAAALGAYTSTLLTGADAVSPVAAGDKFLLARSGAAKTADIDVLSTYVGNKATKAAGTETTFAAGDLVVFNRSGSLKTITIANVVTHVLNGVQASVLNIAALGTATLTDAVLVPICDGTTGKKATLEAVSAYVHAGLNAYTQALSDAATIVDGDKFYVSRAAAAKQIAASDLATYTTAAVWNNSAATDVLDADQIVTRRAGTTHQLTSVSLLKEHIRDAIEGDVLGWELVDTGDYTATPDSTSKILMSDTSQMEVGYPVRYEYLGTVYYGIVAEVSENVHVTIRGAALDVGEDLTDLRVGPAARVVVERLSIPGAYLVPWHVPTGTGSEADMLAEIARRAVAWRHGPAKLVAMAVTQGAEDGTAQPKFNVSIAGDVVLTQDAGAGIQVSATPGAWTWSSAVGIDAAEYSIATGDALEIVCTASGSDGEACDLSVELLFVLE
jgi:hypothetical protein